MELWEEIPIGMVKLSEMVGAGSAETEGLEDFSKGSESEGHDIQNMGGNPHDVTWYIENEDRPDQQNYSESDGVVEINL